MDAFLCSISDAAKALGIGRSKAYLLIAENKLATVKIGNRHLVRIDSIQAFVDSLAEAA